MDKISVIVPVYNAEAYLKFCLDSIVIQEYKKLEVILVDDGSTDSSGEICDYYAARDSRFFVIHKKNEGVSEARNTGIYKATGKYVTFIDCDDYIDSSYFLNIYKVLTDRGGRDFLWWGYVKVSGYEKCDCLKQDIISDMDNKDYVFDRKDVLYLYQNLLLNSPWNKLYRRKVIVSNKIRMKKDWTLGEDLLFNLEYMNCIGTQKIFIINESLYRYVVNRTESLSNREYADKIDIRKLLYENIICYGKKWGVSNGWGKFYSEYLWDLCNMMNEKFEEDQDRTYWDKIRDMNYEMRKKEFTDCIMYKDIRFSHMMEMAFKYRNYLFVRLDLKIEKIKRSLK